MDRIIISVKHAKEDREYDLAVQPDVPLAQLIAFVAEGLQWKPVGCDFYVKLEYPEQSLSTDKTLNDLGIWNGARLIFNPVRNYQEEENGDVIQPGPDDNPFQFRPLKTNKADIPETVTNGTPSGYVWDQID